jgi:hypothetical protein
MNRNRWRKTARQRAESGQALAFLVLALAIVFLGAGAFSVDMSNLWFHRQAAQNAADATCVAGAMDLLVGAQGGATGHQGFAAGSAFNCSAGSTWPICQYAAKNGYTSDGTGNLVSVSFPASVTGVPTGTVPPSGLAPTSFMRVDITDNVQTYFSGMLSGNRNQTVRAFAACGLVLAKAPIPILVLNPTVSGALNLNGGTGSIKIFGGSNQSIQVNSSSATAITSDGTIDLSKGGQNHTGSDLGTYVGPTAPTGTFLPGTTGTWRAPSSPIQDPFSTLAAPAQPANAPLKTHVNYLTFGCPNVSDGCDEYHPGYYSSTINIGPGGGSNGVTAIFDPGLYYVVGGMQLNSNSTVRPAIGAPDPAGWGGTMFYLKGPLPNCSGSPGSICVDANSGSKAVPPAIVSFDTSPVQCPGGDPPDPPLPATLNGNILLAPCAGPYGDPLGKSRGILFFQDRNTVGTGQWGGGGQFLLAGTMYFHQCGSATLGSGSGCDTAGAFNSMFKLNGNPGSGTYILGEIITDKMSLSGTPNVNMQLNPNSTYNTLKATLLR